jgi:5-(carboxyamino)imidazole ribonucleotide synthase
MINLLGEKGHEGEVYIEGLEEAMSIPGVYFHLYGKKTTKPFRKMGHITVCDENIEIAKQKARKLMKLVKIKTN